MSFKLNMPFFCVFHSSQGENGIVFYMTLDVEETKCHVLSKKSYKDCAVRQDDEAPVRLTLHTYCRILCYQYRVNGKCK